MIPSILSGITRRDLERIKTITRAGYPSVSQISTEVLSEWMQGSEGTSLFVVDVRAPAEFRVSHLRGAVNLQTAQQIAQVVAERNPARTILYCSVGFRSTRLAHLVARRGVRDVFNLEGSIFEWANKGRAVYQGERLVRLIHPYSKRWAGLLDHGLASNC